MGVRAGPGAGSADEDGFQYGSGGDVRQGPAVLLQVVAGDEAGQVEPSGQGRQQPDVLHQVGAGEGPGADHVELAVHDLMRVDGGVAAVGVLADDQVRAAAAGQPQPLVDRGGHPGGLDDQVGATAAGQLHDLGERGGLVGRSHDVDMVVADAGLGRGAQPRLRSADEDHPLGAGEFGQGRGGQTDGAAALDHDRLADPDRAALVEGVDHRRTGACEGHRGQRVDPLGHLDHGRTRAQADVVGPGARQARLLVDGPVDAVGAAVLAQGRLAVDPAGHTVAAGDGGRPHHHVADAQRRAVDVRGGPGAEPVHGAQSLVPEHQGRRHLQVSLLQVQVRAADATAVARDDHAALGCRRDRELLQFERLPELGEHDGSSDAHATTSRAGTIGSSTGSRGLVSRPTT